MVFIMSFFSIHTNALTMQHSILQMNMYSISQMYYFTEEEMGNVWLFHKIA